MRSSILLVLVTASLAGLAGCDARPAVPGGNPVPVSGAHTPHLTGVISQPIACNQCHNEAFEVTLQGSLATANGAQGTFDSTSRSCGNVYCHDGGTHTVVFGGGAVPTPVWDPPSAIGCNGCHAPPGGALPTPWHPAVAQGVDCGACHPGFSATVANATVHVNGVVNLTHDDILTSCAACHGDATRVLPDGAPALLLAAPPVDRNGSSLTTDVGVGAHQAHLLPGDGAIAGPVACSECHAVPADLTHVGPALDTPATLTWGPTATAKGAQPSFDASAATCANYCHGATLLGGSNTTPVWTKVDGSQAACGTCHGNPPTDVGHKLHAAPGGVGVSCGFCHPAGYAPGVVGAEALPVHVNGTTNMNQTNGFNNWNPTAPGPNGWTGTATGCHGGTRYWTVPLSGGSCA